MELKILKLLEQHGSLGYEQIAAFLKERPGEVRQALERLRERELVGVLAVGEHHGHATQAASYWRLTDKGLSAAEVVADDPPGLTPAQ